MTPENIETIRLPELLQRIGGALVAQTDVIELVETLRNRELSWRRIFPPTLIRRLDTGFGRSNTVHPDTGRALYAICRTLEPEHVFETGTYWGYSTAYLAAAVRDAGRGRVHSFDLYARAGRHIPKSLQSYVELYRGKPSTQTMPIVLQNTTPTLFFQDSLHDYDGVKSELALVAPQLKPNAIVIFHDFVAEGVRKAALTLQSEFTLYVLESQDPQQIGIAIKND